MNDEIRDIAGTIRVHSGWDIGEDECFIIAKELVKRGYSKNKPEKLVAINREELKKVIFDSFPIKFNNEIIKWPLKIGFVVEMITESVFQRFGTPKGENS